MGEYTHSIAAKGRIILPADFRQELGVSFVITKGLDKCLFLYGQQAWEELAAAAEGIVLAIDTPQRTPGEEHRAAAAGAADDGFLVVVGRCPGDHRVHAHAAEARAGFPSQRAALSRARVADIWFHFSTPYMFHVKQSAGPTADCCRDRATSHGRP